MDPESLLATVDELFELLSHRRVEYVLVGAIAPLQYVEGRNTEDIDLIVALSSLKALPEIALTQRDEYFARGGFAGLQIDLLLTKNPLFDVVRRRYATNGQFGPRSVRVATVEGLLLLKLYALPSLYRQGNFARVALYEGDIVTLMHAYAPNMALLLAELRGHLSASDLAEVRSIVAELQGRIDRFGRAFQ